MIDLDKRLYLFKVRLHALLEREDSQKRSKDTSGWQTIISGGSYVKVAYKVWLDKNGKAFGEGPYKLLKLIEKTGSINRAASEMEMSYRKAWKILKIVEKKLEFELIERKIGGMDGGGSQITDQGREFMKSYEKFRKEVKTSLEKIYKKHFS